VLEAEGKNDRWSAIQRHIIPELDESFIGFNIEMLFFNMTTMMGPCI